MNEFNFTNNAGEKFNFFLNEDNEPCLNVSFKDELTGCFRLQKDELGDLIGSLNEIYKNTIR